MSSNITKKIHHYIRENSLFIHVSFKKDDVLCLPNFWLLVLYSKTPCVVEKNTIFHYIEWPRFVIRLNQH